jgi:[ribosomal protein S5]-alanine N-acetyltransferase
MRSKEMPLVLERCAVRHWRVEDAAPLATHANNRKIWLGLRDLFPHPYTIDHAREFLHRTLTAKPITGFCIDIDGVAVGGIGIQIGEDIHRHTAELGYWLSEDFWGHGVTSEAVPEFTTYCFENFPLHRIYAEPYANNPASARVLEKAGFVLEGRLKNNVFKDGQILDSLLYAKTQDAI